MLRIELDDLSRPQVLALVHEHLQNMHELSPPDKVFAFDPSKLKTPDVTVWTAWRGDVLLGCAALKESPQWRVRSSPCELRARSAGLVPVELS